MIELLGALPLLIFLLLGLAIANHGMKEVLKSRRSTRWPTTEGLITRSEVKVDRDGGCTSYSPDIEFSYTIGEKAYRSTSVRVGRIAMRGRADVEAFNNRYLVGHVVTAAYDPNNHAYAVLEPGLFKHSLVLVIFGSLFAYGAALMLLACWMGIP